MDLKEKKNQAGNHLAGIPAYILGTHLCKGTICSIPTNWQQQGEAAPSPLAWAAPHFELLQSRDITY